MGLIGGIMILAGVVVFAMEEHSGLEVFLYLTLVVISVIALVKFALWSMRHTARGTVYSDAHQTGFHAASFDKSLIGKQGAVLTDLKPGGHIIIEGKRVQAISKSNYLPKGTEVLVIGGQEDSLIVIKLEKKEEHHD